MFSLWGKEIVRSEEEIRRRLKRTGKRYDQILAKDKSRLDHPGLATAATEMILLNWVLYDYKSSD